MNTEFYDRFVKKEGILSFIQGEESIRGSNLAFVAGTLSQTHRQCSLKDCTGESRSLFDK